MHQITKKNKTIIAEFIFIKYIYFNSLIKLFALLRGLYNFSTISINTNFDIAHIKALKNCETFNKKPYIICCLFHLSQAILKNFKKYELIKKNVNKRAYEILYNLEILSFIELNNVDNYFKYLKEKISESEKEKKFMIILKKYKKA